MEKKDFFRSLGFISTAWLFIGWSIAYLVINNIMDFHGVTRFTESYLFFVKNSDLNYQFGKHNAYIIFYTIASLTPLMLISFFIPPEERIFRKNVRSSMFFQIRAVLILSIICIPCFFLIPNMKGPLGLFLRSPYAFSSSITLTFATLAFYIRAIIYCTLIKKPIKP